MKNTYFIASHFKNVSIAQITFMFVRANFVILLSFTMEKAMEYWLHELSLNETILNYLMTHNDIIFIKIVSLHKADQLWTDYFVTKKKEINNLSWETIEDRFLRFQMQLLLSKRLKAYMAFKFS